ncbi:MAG TPA: CHAP domain-containing protein [Rhizomicrobium sp.]|jgi:surface antigen
MKGLCVRSAMVIALGLAAAGCAGTSDVEYSALPHVSGDRSRVEMPSTPVECVPYARNRSGVTLYGDAGSWWVKAEGRYVRRANPKTGSVMVLTGYAGPGRGHVAVVTELVSRREVMLDHANWLGDGAIYLDDPAVDVSPENDWSEVRVWNTRAHSWGVRTYLVQGFIGPEAEARTARVATN